jgi:small subunit ribosomal protein S1
VAAVHSYGAFVDLGGRIQGLLHVSEMGWSRVADAGQVVRPGDEVTVKVLQVDEAKGKISLGLKQLQPDPWATATDTYEVGQVLQGRVTRVVEFGAFIELQPGIEALAHASTFPPTAAQEGFRASVSSGATVAVKVLSFDPERKRIGVAVVDEAQVRTAGSPEGGIVPGARVRGQVQRHEKFGLIVFLAPGRSGLVPLAESGAEKEGDLARTFPVGSDIDVIVTEVDPAGSRIRLSRKAVLEAEGRREARDYAQRQDQRQSEGFGSLADKLRQAIRPRED